MLLKSKLQTFFIIHFSPKRAVGYGSPLFVAHHFRRRKIRKKVCASLPCKNVENQVTGSVKNQVTRRGGEREKEMVY